MINTIIFDMGMVLIDFRWEALFHEMGLEGERFERMADATVRDPVWNEFDRGIWTDEMMLEAFIERAPELESELRDLFYNRFTGLLRKFDYTDEWLDALKKKGYKIYILSNFSRKGIEECPDELDYMKKADGEVISYRVNLIKPDPRIYEHILDKFDITPSEAVFIDDNADNIEAAKKFGINTILFRGKEDADRELAKLGVNY
ncbi:MAG: HAD family phosphatase [Lachnospiraceae bacterium]|nr:HAD family phosphatase [Lachnospiraceae bacterium]